MPPFPCPPSTSTPQGGYTGTLQGYPFPTNNQTEPDSPPFCEGVEKDDLVYQSFTAKNTKEQGDNVVLLYSTFKFNRWPKGATSMYCAVRTSVCMHALPCPSCRPAYSPTFPPVPPPSPSADP